MPGLENLIGVTFVMQKFLGNHLSKIHTMPQTSSK